MCLEKWKDFACELGKMLFLFSYKFRFFWIFLVTFFVCYFSLVLADGWDFKVRLRGGILLKFLYFHSTLGVDF